MAQMTLGPARARSPYSANEQFDSYGRCTRPAMIVKWWWGDLLSSPADCWSLKFSNHHCRRETHRRRLNLCSLRIDSIRRMGNIGAHRQKHSNLIVDVDPDEARRLSGLVERSIEATYPPDTDYRLVFKS